MYYTCNYCGSNLDPGEKCDCENSKSIGTSRTLLTRRERKTYSTVIHRSHRHSVKKEVAAL